MARSTLALVEPVSDIDNIRWLFESVDRGSSMTKFLAFTCGSKITAEFRELITDYHNSVRSKIAHGIERNHTGKLPSAKNMYEVAWDCELEKLAEKVAADEDFDVESIRPRAVNIDRRAHCESFELTYHRDIGKSLRRWEYEIRDFGQTSPENLYNDDSLEHFANMAYGKNTKIGCSYDRKGKALTFVCVYDLGAVWDEPIYELGPRCQKDSDCTTYENSKCDMLCVKK
ncbi:SCP-like protein [Ancylostoma caninum]|uniref:SCP-like protein n=1 Tax=Ancylostoma caninum TaxID=29170 RepID=A0A368FBI8_ANCCA|nr:SCP-like protein [Ancylostoma caninum]